MASQVTDPAPEAAAHREHPVWTLEHRIGRQLLAWGAGSVVLGALLAALPLGGIVAGVGVQFVVWGAIDAAIAVFGARSLRRKLERGADPRAEARSLRRILLINAGLDVLYVAAGIGVLIWTDGAFATGNGVGVIVQGGFLLLFDAWHAFRSLPHARRAG